MASTKKEKPASQISIKGKQLHDIRTFAELFFKQAFMDVLLSGDKKEFILNLTDEADETMCLQFEEKFKMCRIEKFTKVTRDNA